MVATTTDTTLALKEWGAVAQALLTGRQSLLLRKGGIHERSFDVATDRFLLFPTVAHSHAERVRAEHQDLLAAGAADLDDDAGTFVVRCGVELVAVVPTMQPERLDALTDLHIWTPEHARERMAFRPRHPLQVLVVRAFALDQPRSLVRLDSYGGCKSWLDLPLPWNPGAGRQVLPDARLAADATRVRTALN